MPPTYYAFVYMLLDALLYGVLAWYLDAVLRGEAWRISLMGLMIPVSGLVFVREPWYP